MESTHLRFRAIEAGRSTAGLERVCAKRRCESANDDLGRGLLPESGGGLVTWGLAAAFVLAYVGARKNAVMAHACRLHTTREAPLDALFIRTSSFLGRYGMPFPAGVGSVHVPMAGGMTAARAMERIC